MKRPYKAEQYKMTGDWGITLEDCYLSGIRFPDTEEGKVQLSKVVSAMNSAFAHGMTAKERETAEKLSIYESTLKWYADQDIGGSARAALRQV